MKRLTIRIKIMLWYTLSLLLVMGVMFTAIQFVLLGVLRSNAESMVKAYCAQASSYVEAENGSFQMDADMPAILPDISFQAYDENNVIVYTYGILNTLNASAPEFDTTRTISNNGENWLVYDQKFTEDGNFIGWIRVAKSLQYIDDTLQNMLIIFLISCPIFLILALIVGFFVAKKSLQPIDQITLAAGVIGRGDLSRRLNMTNTGDEVGRLSATFDEMIERLDIAFQNEKQFTSDASHELRTPVAVISAYAENALSSDPSVNSLTGSMEVILNESRKMNAIISRLLMLTRGDLKKYDLILECIDLGQSATGIVEEMTRQAEQKGVTMTLTCRETILVQVDQTLLTHLLLNVLDNAIKYNRVGGNVKVDIHKEKQNAVITIQDNGIGIPKQDLPKIFNRFYRAEHTSETEGSGLGLAIAKWIVELHRGTIQIDSDLSTGTTVIISLPLNASK